MAASTNYTDLAYDKETVFGTTDGTPTFTLLPTTGGSPVNNISTAVSEVIRSDRQTDDLVVVDGDISGELNYELSYAPYEDFIESVLMNTTTRAISLSTVTNNGTIDATIIGNAGIEAVCLVGDVVRLASITDSSINGEYIITALGTDEVTLDRDTGATAALTDLTVVADDIRVNGASPIQGYTIRKKVEDAGTPYYFYYRGCAVNSMSFNFVTGSILNGSVGIVGLTEEARTTVLTGETADTPTPAYSIMNSVSSVALIDIAGVSATFSSLDISIDNQINAAKAVGTLGAIDLAAFSVMISANAEVYFSSLDLYNKFLAATSFSITLIMTDSDGNTIAINMPKCKFETLDTPISGKDAFLMQSGTIKALRDTTGNYMVKITRIDA